MALCTTCNSFDLYQIFNYPDVGLPTNVVLDRQYFWDEHLDSLCFRHSDNISQIQAAASAGCGLCTLLFDAFKRKEPGAAQLAGDLPIILTQGKTIEDYKNDPPHFSPYLEPKLRSFFASPEEGPISLCDLDISIDYNSVNIPSNLPFEPLSKLYPHSKDPGCVALASRWLTSCLEDHACPAPNSTGPRSLIRFLHVGSESRNPHLVEFPPRVSLRPWIALSYRWGDREPPLKLMKRTEKLLKDGVEISALDATIQDAIIISRGLGIQYLWVDALCIFQDQESDWLEQSSQMSFIYGQSTVTIASVDTDDASQSFLRQRETQYVGISWKEETNQVASDECRNPPQVYVSHSWPDRNDQLTGPWSKRAWTLQEGLLPNRILFYSSHHIAWKCCSMVRYERAVQHVPMTEFVLSIVDEPGGRPFWTFDLFTKFKLLPKYLENPECHSLHDRYRIWCDIVEDYSARCVKYRRDRLVAVSVIARMYGAILQSDRYVAGLWQSDMLPGLLWYAEGLELFGNKLGQSTHDVEVEAPSWSWANAPCGYTIRNDWTNKSLRSLAALEDVSFDLVESSNPFGGVLHAQVTIRGPVCRFSRLYHPTWRSASSNLSAFERHLSRVVELDYGQRANEFSGEGCYAALLLVQEFPSIDCRVDALILRRSQSRKDERGTVFERLGVLRLSFYSIPTSPSFLSRRIGPQEQSLDHRLNSRGGVRRSKRIFCREVFQEYKRSRWPRESIRIV